MSTMTDESVIEVLHEIFSYGPPVRGEVIDHAITAIEQCKRWEAAWDEVRQEFADDPNDDYGAYLRNVGRLDDLDPRKKEKG